MMDFILDRKNYIAVYVIGYLLRGIIYHFFPFVNPILTALTVFWPVILLLQTVRMKQVPDRLQISLSAFLAGAVISTLVNISEATADAFLSLWQIVSLILIFSCAKGEDSRGFLRFYERLAWITAAVIFLLAAGSLFLLACYRMNVSLPLGLADADHIFTYGHMGEESRFCGLFGYSADGGNLCALAAVLLLYLLEKGRINRILYAAATAVFVITIYFLDVRTSMVELLVVLILLIWKQLRRKFSACQSFLFLGGAAVLMLGTVFALKNQAVSSFLEQMKEDPEKTLRFLTTGRSTYWAYAWNGFLRHPLFGMGWTNNSHMFRTYFDSHNLFFNLIYWTGLCGMIPLGFFVWFFLKRMKEVQPGISASVILLFAVIAESMLDRAILGTANTAPETSFFWLTAGLLAYALSSVSEKEI